jgi:hypothetical protein
MNLCWQADIPYEAIHSETFALTLIALVEYAEIHSLFDQLLDYCQRYSPNSWSQALQRRLKGTLARTNTQRPAFLPIRLPTKPEDIFVRKFRLDAALPQQVQHGRSFELAIAIRQPNSPKLQEDELDKTKSGNLQVNLPDDVDMIALQVHISAPECQIHGSNSCLLRLHKDQNSLVYYFQLTPQQSGRIGMVVTVYYKDEWLGGTRLHTLAQAQVVGQIALDVYSRPLSSGILGISYEVQLSVALTLRALFNLAELRQVCFELQVLFEDLPGETVSDKSRELVMFMVRHGRLADLVQQCQKARPSVEWEALADILPARA